MKKYKEHFKKFTTVLLSVSLIAVLMFVSSCGNEAKEETLDRVFMVVDDTDYFSTFREAIDESGLRDSLSDVGPLTLFAPYDDAFAEVDADTLAAIFASQSKLKKMVLNHFVAGKTLSSDLSNGDLVTLNDGEKVTVDLSNGGIMINDASVIGPDNEASDGVVHVINSVLMPDNF